MRTNLSTLLVSIACSVLIAACAGTPPPSRDVMPPQRQMPLTAAEACAVFVITGVWTLEALETGYNARGQNVADCNDKRQLGVDTHAGEHADEAKWAAEKAGRRKPAWKVW